MGNETSDRRTQRDRRRHNVGGSRNIGGVFSHDDRRAQRRRGPLIDVLDRVRALEICETLRRRVSDPEAWLAAAIVERVAEIQSDRDWWKGQARDAHEFLDEKDAPRGHTDSNLTLRGRIAWLLDRQR